MSSEQVCDPHFTAGETETKGQRQLSKPRGWCAVDLEFGFKPSQSTARALPGAISWIRSCENCQIWGLPREEGPESGRGRLSGKRTFPRQQPPPDKPRKFSELEVREPYRGTAGHEELQREKAGTAGHGPPPRGASCPEPRLPVDAGTDPLTETSTQSPCSRACGDPLVLSPPALRGVRRAGRSPGDGQLRHPPSFERGCTALPPDFPPAFFSHLKGNDSGEHYVQTDPISLKQSTTQQLINAREVPGKLCPQRPVRTGRRAGGRFVLISDLLSHVTFNV